MVKILSNAVILGFRGSFVVVFREFRAALFSLEEVKMGYFFDANGGGIGEKGPFCL